MLAAAVGAAAAGAAIPTTAAATAAAAASLLKNFKDNIIAISRHPASFITPTTVFWPHLGRAVSDRVTKT